jgi:hypothetical protein
MDTIEFLERMGSDASVFHGLEDAQQADGAQLAPGEASALATRDVEAIYRLLGRTMLICVQIPGEEEEAPDEDEGDADERQPELRR